MSRTTRLKKLAKRREARTVAEALAKLNGEKVPPRVLAYLGPAQHGWTVGYLDGEYWFGHTKVTKVALRRFAQDILDNL